LTVAAFDHSAKIDSYLDIVAVAEVDVLVRAIVLFNRDVRRGPAMDGGGVCCVGSIWLASGSGRRWRWGWIRWRSDWADPVANSMNRLLLVLWDAGAASLRCGLGLADLETGKHEGWSCRRCRVKRGSGGGKLVTAADKVLGNSAGGCTRDVLFEHLAAECYFIVICR